MYSLGVSACVSTVTAGGAANVFGFAAPIDRKARKRSAMRFYLAVVERRVLLDLAHASGHHVFDARVERVLAVGDAADDDVAVGDHTDDLLPVDHRHDAGVLFLHDPGGVVDAVALRHGLRIGRHHVA